MVYTEKFQAMADAAQEKANAVAPEEVDSLLKFGAVALDIRDKEEHDAGHISGSINISRGKLEMNIEGQLPDLDTDHSVLLQRLQPWRAVCGISGRYALQECPLYCGRPQRLSQGSLKNRSAII